MLTVNSPTAAKSVPFRRNLRSGVQAGSELYHTRPPVANFSSHLLVSSILPLTPVSLLSDIAISYDTPQPSVSRTVTSNLVGYRES